MPINLVRRLGLTALLVAPAALADSTVHVPLDEPEARALVAMIPAVHQARIEGFEIIYGLVDDSANYTSDYYVYRIVVRTDAPSGLIGFYAVNKWTADVWNAVLTVWECSPELEKVQAAMRSLHGINDEVIAAYRDKPFYTGETHAGDTRCRDDK